ncbi:hypothetical protein AB4Y89_12760 [Terriglobus sp. 2YAB30_2]|uniref:hypothetical protein n=1 Tax=unclassified Terriglobus TaxID=2628988 RepID=UPI003F97D6D5
MKNLPKQLIADHLIGQPRNAIRDIMHLVRLDSLAASHDMSLLERRILAALIVLPESTGTVCLLPVRLAMAARLVLAGHPVEAAAPLRQEAAVKTSQQVDEYSGSLGDASSKGFFD